MYIYMCAMCVYACKIRTCTHNNIIYVYNIVNDRELRKQTEPRVLPTRIRRFCIIITSLL